MGAGGVIRRLSALGSLLSEITDMAMNGLIVGL